MPKCGFNNFIEITLRHGCTPVNLLHFFKTPFPKNTSGGLLLWFSVNQLENNDTSATVGYCLLTTQQTFTCSKSTIET